MKKLMMIGCGCAFLACGALHAAVPQLKGSPETAGSMGLNLQKANVAVYFSPPLESIKYEQSKKRIHRIGQNDRCIYYRLITAGSIEERIYAVLAERKDYTDALFKAENKGERENGKRKDT